MKLKKLILSGAVATFAMAVSITAYAAATDYFYQEKVVLPAGDGTISLTDVDKNHLPEGVSFQDEIHLDSEGGISFNNVDKDALPEGLIFQEKINSEGALSFDNVDEDSMAAGVYFQEEINLGSENGIPLK
ncbi:MAG: hypothetical protein Q4B90_04670 [Eubacteriales bacterium]|nr:hypothetical protein [Eubacteriales bacterium]